MKEEVVILLAEDDEGHAGLIENNLLRAGIKNKIIHFKDGDETLDFLLSKGDGPHLEDSTAYLLLLDIRMPRVDGIEVLETVKSDKKLSRMPVIMITTTDDPREVKRCHDLGCNTYITKPINYEKFMNAIKQLGLFLLVVNVPDIDG